MTADAFLYRKKDGVEWVCIRPAKRYTRFRMSLQARSYSKLPQLLGLSVVARVELDEDGRVWATGLPEVHKLVARALADPGWLFEIIAIREQEFDRIREHSDDMLRRLNSKQVPEQLRHSVASDVRKWRDLHDTVFHLILLNALIVDETGERFFRFLVDSVGNQLALKHTTELFRTPYAEESKKEGKTVFLKHTDLYRTLEDTSVPQAKTNLSPVSSYESQVVNHLLTLPLGDRAKAWGEYCVLRLIAPVLVQLNDEQAYLWRAHGMLVMKVIQEYEDHERETNPQFRVQALDVGEFLSLLES